MCCNCSTRQGVATGESKILKQRAIFDECSFSSQGAINKQNCKIRGSQCPKTVHESPQSSAMLIVCCAIFKNEVIGPNFFDDGNETGDRYKWMFWSFFSKFANYPSGMIHLTVWGFPALRNSSQKILGPKTCKQMNGVGRTDFLAWSIF